MFLGGRSGLAQARDEVVPTAAAVWPATQMDVGSHDLDAPHLQLPVQDERQQAYAHLRRPPVEKIRPGGPRRVAEARRTRAHAEPREPREPQMALEHERPAGLAAHGALDRALVSIGVDEACGDQHRDRHQQDSRDCDAEDPAPDPHVRVC